MRALGWSLIAFGAWVLYPLLPAEVARHLEQRLETELSLRKT